MNEVFKRRDSIGRSPPTSRKGSFSSDGQNEVGIGNFFDKITEKRKLGEVSFGNQTSNPKRDRGALAPIFCSNPGNLRSNVDELAKKAGELIQFGAANQNVHKTVKSLVAELKYIIDKIKIDVKRTEAENKKGKEHANKVEELGTQINEKDTEIIELKQKIEILEEKNIHLANQLEKQKNDKISKNEDVVSLENLDLDDYKSSEELIKRTWSPTLYRITELEEKTALGRRPDHLFFFLKRDQTLRKKREGLSGEITNRFPEMRDENPVECEGGAYLTLEELVKYRIGGTGEEKKKMKTLTALYAEGTEKEWDTFKILKQVRNIADKAKATEITIVAPTDLDPRLFRKMVECVLKDSTKKIKVWCNEGSLPKIAIKDRRQRGEALIIEPNQGKSYAEMLQILRSSTNKNIGSTVKQVRQTANGNLLLKLRDNSQLESTKQEVAKALGDLRVRVTGKGTKTKTFFIRDLDMVATAEEVKEVLTKEKLIKNWDNANLTVRKNPFGGQTATLKISDSESIDIEVRSHVRVGLSDCRIHERIEIDRCYRCWSFGHEARDCKETEVDMENKCFRCGGAGHRKADCKEKREFCPSCNEEGHQAGTSKCASFRKALYLERKKRSTIREQRRTSVSSLKTDQQD